MDETNRPSQSDGSERITAENMALLCSKNIQLDLEPIQIPDTTSVGQVSVIVRSRHITIYVFLKLRNFYYQLSSICQPQHSRLFQTVFVGGSAEVQEWTI